MFDIPIPTATVTATVTAKGAAKGAIKAKQKVKGKGQSNGTNNVYRDFVLEIEQIIKTKSGRTQTYHLKRLSN